MTVLERLNDPKFRHGFIESLDEAQRVQVAKVIQSQLDAQRYDWLPRLRDKQRWPEGDYNVELKLAGRGFGKTLAGAVWVKEKLLEYPGCRVAILSPTSADARDTCVEGASGLLNVIAPEQIKTWNRSLGELVMVNGSRVKLFTGDEPDRLRGPQHHFAWVDELAAFRYPEAWDQLQFGLRLGDKPQVMVTTTPRPTKLIRELVNRSDVHVTRGSTFENADNLAPNALEELRRQYEGTRLGRQELEAELLLDTPGALWTYDLIDQGRVQTAPEMVKIVVAVDPSGGAGPENDEQGIVVTGKGTDGHGYTIEDRSCSLSPNGWGRRAVQAYLDHKADAIIVERNYGGDMAEETIKRAATDMGVANIVIKPVTSSRGKRLRAEPVAALYEQSRWHHLGRFEALEDQMVTWTPESGISPDRLDAMCFGANYLFGTEEKKGFVLV